MCLDFCAQVVERSADEVLVEGAGVRRRASTLLVPDAAVGDWVRIALGTVIERLDEAAAQDVNNHVLKAKGAAT